MDELTMRAVLIILLLVGNCLGGETNVPALFNLAEVVPKGKCELEPLTVEFSDRAKELTRKWQAAVATNQDWFVEYVKLAKPGQSLEYDARLGVTKEEYEAFARMRGWARG